MTVEERLDYARDAAKNMAHLNYPEWSRLVLALVADIEKASDEGWIHPRPEEAPAA